MHPTIKTFPGILARPNKNDLKPSLLSRDVAATVRWQEPQTWPFKRATWLPSAARLQKRNGSRKCHGAREVEKAKGSPRLSGTTKAAASTASGNQSSQTIPTCETNLPTESTDKPLSSWFFGAPVYDVCLPFQQCAPWLNCCQVWKWKAWKTPLQHQSSHMFRSTWLNSGKKKSGSEHSKLSHIAWAYQRIIYKFDFIIKS